MMPDAVRGRATSSPARLRQAVRRLQRGSVLLPVVVAITLLAAITFMLSYQGVSRSNIVTGEIERDRLRYVAEAGIAHARSRLALNTSCKNYADMPKTDFAGATYLAQVTPKEGSPVRIRSSADWGSNKSLTLLSQPISAFAPPTTFVLQLSTTSGEDTLLDDGSSTRNYGGASSLALMSGSQNRRPMLRFPLDAIPADAMIQLARLEMTQWNATVPGEVTVHRLTRDWVEGTRNGGGVADGATWDTYDGLNSWSQPGGDYDPAIYSARYVTSGGVDGLDQWDITDLVREWVSGKIPNYGLLLLGDGTVNNVGWGSRETNNPLQTPRLTIVYACECGKSCAGAPVSGKNVLLVVGDTANLTVEQQAKKTLMEAWGHTVSLIATSASQAEFDSDAGNNDVVYVPELGSTPMSELGDKADNLAKGVITEESRKALLMGGFSLLPFVDTDSINITDNSHYLTETLPIGNVQLSTAVQSFWVLKPALASDLHVLGELNGAEPGLAYLDNGELRNDSSPAPARRVKLPWGAYNFDVNLLTDDGLEIMQRAIEWASLEPPVLRYRDEFTNRNCDAADYAGSNGTLDWSPWSWTEGFDDDSSCTGSVMLTEDDVVVEPGNYRMRFSGNNRSAERTADLTGFTVAWLNFEYRREALMTGDYVAIEVWDDAGGVWVELANIAGPGSDADYQRSSYDVSTYISASFAVRYKALGMGPNNYVYIDNVEIAPAGGDTGPVAHWKLDETGGNTAVDSVGGNDGTLQNGPVWTTGNIDGGLDFDGNDDTVSAGAPAALQDIFDGGGTLTAWMRPTGWGEGNYGRIVDKSSATYPGNGWAFELYGANASFLIQFGFTGATGSWITPNGSVGLDAWQHIALAYDNSSDANDPIVYIDGVSQAITELDTPSGTLRSDAGINLTIGNHAMSTVRTFNGTLDDIRIYDRMLSATEVAELAAGGSGGGGGGGGGACDGTYLDQFEVYQFDNSDGTLDWTTSPWQEIGESDGPTAGDIRIWSDLDSVRIRTRDNDNGGEGIERDADLSGATAATLSYDYRRDRLDSSDDYTTVEVSANGAAGPWTELARYAGPDNDSAYTTVSHDIAAFIAGNTRIRFRTSSSMGGLDHVWFDNVQIQCAP